MLGPVDAPMLTAAEARGVEAGAGRAVVGVKGGARANADAAIDPVACGRTEETGAVAGAGAGAADGEEADEGE